MISALTFGAAQVRADARAIRFIRFVSRSTLPLSAACLVANGVREQLARLLATDVDVDLVEPAVPDARERRVLLEGAVVARVRGRICDGFVVVRPEDSRRLVALAFGEAQRSDRDALSEIERATLERIVFGLVPLCNTLCGTLGPVARESSERAACDIATYFEVRTTGPVRITIGFALTRDPPEAVGETLTIDDLGDVEIAGDVAVASGTLGVPAFSRLAAGATIVLDTPLGASGVLRFGDVPFAYGTCGVSDGRRALSLDRDAGTPRPSLRGAA